MAKTATKVQAHPCEAYGIAFLEDDAQCITCGDASVCKVKTEQYMAGAEGGAVDTLEDQDPLGLEPGETGEALGEFEDLETVETHDKFPATGKGDFLSNSLLLTVLVRMRDMLTLIIDQAGIGEVAPSISKAKAAIPGTTVAAPTSSTARAGTKAQLKQAARDEMAAGIPYTKVQLAEFSGKQIKQLAAAMKINSFGQTRDAVVLKILQVQAKMAAGRGKK
jgi:hypothetical protein